MGRLKLKGQYQLPDPDNNLHFFSPPWLKSHPELWTRKNLVVHLMDNKGFRVRYLKMVDDLCSLPAHVGKYRLAGLILGTIYNSCQQRLENMRPRLEAKSHRLYNEAAGAIRNIARNSMLKIRAVNKEVTLCRPPWYGACEHDVVWRREGCAD